MMAKVAEPVGNVAPLPRLTVDYWRNVDKGTPDGASPCARCGRPVTSPAGWVHLVNGGDQMSRVGYGNDGNDAGDCGAYPVGSECAKHFPAAFLYPAEPIPDGS